MSPVNLSLYGITRALISMPRWPRTTVLSPFLVSLTSALRAALVTSTMNFFTFSGSERDSNFITLAVCELDIRDCNLVGISDSSGILLEPLPRRFTRNVR